MNLNLIFHKTELKFVNVFRFELIIVVLYLAYGWFYCTPSSYGEAMKILGIPNDGLMLGKSQGSRSDEWSVWTPYLQALVNNHFERFNALSIYHEDFRNFNALPIYDWGLIFKPQFWPFLLFEPARAFSLHHGILIATFVIGWKQLIEKLFRSSQYTYSGVAIGFSLVLFFSGFVQTFWTTVGPLLAFFPWLMMVLLSWRSHSLGYYILLAYVTTVWLLSHLYPPLVISCLYLGLILLGIYQPGFFSNRRRLLLSLLAFCVGIGIVAIYLEDAILIMKDTVYPGKRISVGGEDRFYNWLAIFIPYITHTENAAVAGLNFCEATSVSSLLPLLCLCFVDFNNRTIRTREVIIYLSALCFFSAWMLISVPLWLGKLFLLTKIPGHRLVFLLGMLINFLAVNLLVKNEIKLSLCRVLLFSQLLFLLWNIPVFYQYLRPFEKSMAELWVIPLLGLIYVSDCLWQLQSKLKVMLLVGLALLPNVYYFGLFNPVQSSSSIFNAKNSEIVKLLHDTERKDSRGWLVLPGVPAAILNGLGLKSVTHTLIMPQLSFFRKLFPELPFYELNQIFNRYAHVHVFDIEKPELASLDSIKIPIQSVLEINGSDFSIKTAAVCEKNAKSFGNLDRLVISGNKIKLAGWAMSSEHRFLTNLKTSSFDNPVFIHRLDIANYFHDYGLLRAGFYFEIIITDDDLYLVNREGFCLFSESNKYGKREILYLSPEQIRTSIR